MVSNKGAFMLLLELTTGAYFLSNGWEYEPIEKEKALKMISDTVVLYRS